MATTVTWVQDVSGNYEVSSPEHLKQIMNIGGLYTNAGTAPPNSWSKGSNINFSYIQTADIDLLNDSTDIKPIGLSTLTFDANYDGNGFKISNWSYIDPEFSTSNDCEAYVGLFGHIGANVTLKNIRLDGVWTMQGFDTNSGFLIGYTETQGEILNIECNFSSGSFIDNSTGSFGSFGTVCGNIRCDISGVIVKGSIDFLSNTHQATYCGGLIATTSESPSFLQNFAKFPSGINGNWVGGLIGYHNPFNGTCSNYINAMIGDVNGQSYAGGIIGYSTSNFANYDTIVNSMSGNITSTSVSGTGGIFGYCSSNVTSLNLINYMAGDISDNVGNTSAGGIVGVLVDGGSTSFTSSINAMNGNVYNAVTGSSGGTLDVTVNQNFGLTFSIDNRGTASPPSGLLINSEFTDLPYTLLTGTDSDGNSYDFDFVYANLAGNSSYSSFTHLILHKGDISIPFFVDFDISAGSTIFLTYANLGATSVTPASGLVVLSSESGVTLIIPMPLTADARAINIPVVIEEVTGAIGYRITYQAPAGSEITAFSEVTTLEHNITGVEPSTAYTVRLYADTGSGYEIVETVSVTTLANIAANYNVADFTENGIINLTSLPENTVSDVNEVMDELFSTGDIVQVDLSIKSNVVTSFINLGDTLSIKDINGILLPFESTGGAGQDVNVLYSDDITTEGIAYDETNNNITVESVTYNPGDNFIIDGLKATVLEY